MSLKANLNQIIKNRGGQVFTLDELKQYCEQASYKLSNAERRLRPSDSPYITGVDKNGNDTDHHKAIVGYRWKASDFLKRFQSEFPPKQPVKEGVRLW